MSDAREAREAAAIIMAKAVYEVAPWPVSMRGQMWKGFQAALDALLASDALESLMGFEPCGAMETFIAGDGLPAIRQTPGPLFRRRSPESPEER